MQLMHPIESNMTKWPNRPHELLKHSTLLENNKIIITKRENTGVFEIPRKILKLTFKKDHLFYFCHSGDMYYMYFKKRHNYLIVKLVYLFKFRSLKGIKTVQLK